jgi:thiol:disulfide interchange protein
MKRILMLAAFALIARGNAVSSALPKAAAPAGEVASYDAKRDAAADIKAALAEAKKAHKRLMIDAGGAWAPRAAVLEKYYADHKDHAALRLKNYILVKVSVASGGAVPTALAAYPKPAGFPHLYVLDENGSMIQSQDMKEFEKGDGYDAEKFGLFLKSFGPSNTERVAKGDAPPPNPEDAAIPVKKPEPKPKK